MRFAIAVLLGALIGCGSNSGGTGSGSTPDGGGPPPSTDVVGKYHTACPTAAGDVDIPVDLSQPQAVPTALVPDGSGAYQSLTAVGSADGSFVLHGVPPGATYLLQTSSNTTANGVTYLVSDQRMIDLHRRTAIRCSPAPVKATAAVNVTLDITNMSPFQPGDRLELDSVSLGTSVTVTSPATGSTELHTSVTWSQGRALIDASAGDDLRLFHVRRGTLSGPSGILGATLVLIESFDATGATMQNGTPLALSGAFQPVTTTRVGTLTIDNAGLAAGYDRTSRGVGVEAFVTAAPPGRPGGGLGGPILLQLLPSNAPTTGTVAIDYRNADPFPDAWTRTVLITDSRIRSTKLSSDPQGVTGIGAANQQQSAYTGAIVATHALQPATGITVGGIDFERGGAVKFDGQSTVVVRWNPVAGAQLYQVALGTPGATPMQVSFTTLVTADTSVTVPASLIQAGAMYQLVVHAVQTPTDYAGGSLLATTQASVGVPSARFRFLPSCGDGVVQANEDCDTSGESATCNADCTIAMCGDGVVNASAGEQCDTVGASDTCTAGCKLP